ncbi:MAG: hypothetical protein JNK78_11435 [Planctomycetes bacterium]|nr:hypothetical protein [Planctomycetota bacterium]
MHRAHFALFAAAALSACNVGFDPRNLERLEYGMEQRRIAELLESDEPAVPLFRCFVVGEDGRSQDVGVVLHESLSPHPLYLSVSIDGRLAAVTILPPSDRNPWQPYDRRESSAIAVPWRPDELSALVRGAMADRVELAWSALGPVDAARSEPRAGRGATAIEGTMFVLPLVLYLPYWAYMNTLGDEGRGRATAARERLLAAPASTTPAELVEAFGEPDSDRRFELPEGAHRVLAWTFWRFTITAGFLDERLLWADFGPWRSWVSEFME